MPFIQKKYYLILSDYVRSREVSMYRKQELGRCLQSLSPEEISSIHNEALQLLLDDKLAGDPSIVYKRSTTLLVELTTEVKNRSFPQQSSEETFNEMKELLFKSNRSTQLMKDKYENVLQHMDSGIALFDKEGLLTFVNLQMARILDIPRTTLIGCDVRGIVTHAALRKTTKRMIIGLFKQMIRQRSRYFELQDAGGRHLLVTVTYGDQLDGDYLISVKDVSEYKQIEQTAYQNDKLAMLGKIAAAIAHEIRNPLTSIRGFIQLLRPHLLALGKEEYARIILSEIDRANEIINEFLNSSKPSAPMMQLVSINSLLKEVILLTESEALMKGSVIGYEGSSDGLQVSIDMKQVKQVILNILKNALDAIVELGGEREGRIEVISRKEGRYAEITIRDNGKGMEKQTMNRLFDPFFTTKAEGTGLGLSVSYRIIRNHGGFIKVDSNSGEGTEFTIYLPMVR
ncbi:ATP-binding protein [Paenibacillus daejeonensis]|uniref:ATP-binding protein n=1 Tax=Paenibacillus daejeonensis TaxID=135193 RepID=UPI0003632F36|nr:ATP-binding protein [Paenibacillus daejeonensis]